MKNTDRVWAGIAALLLVAFIANVAAVKVTEEIVSRYMEATSVDPDFVARVMRKALEYRETVPAPQESRETQPPEGQEAASDLSQEDPAAFTGKGIDISYHNGVIDWKTVAEESGISFAILRIGHGSRGNKDGGIREDEKIRENMRGTAQAGILTAYYFYSYANSVKSVYTEALNVLALLQKLGIPNGETIYYDIEESYQMRYATAYTKAFCEVIQTGGYRCGVYICESGARDYLDRSKLPQTCRYWIANWGKKDYGQSYDILQYSDNGRVPGINGAVDLNLSAYEPLEGRERDDYNFSRSRKNASVYPCRA